MFVPHQQIFVPLDGNKCAGFKTLRLFCAYDSKNDPDKRIQLFKANLENSFPQLGDRIKFINKLYQCLLGQWMPLKLKKLIACGEQDSGKTTWMYLLKGFMANTSMLLECLHVVRSFS